MPGAAGEACPPTEHGCFADPCGSYVARCDPERARCIVAAQDEAHTKPAPTGELTLRLSCEQHGAAISTRVVEVHSSPPSIRTQTNDQPEHRADLEASDLRPLRAVLNTEAFAAFVDETPTPGQPKPGIEYCTLDATAPGIAVQHKKWRNVDELSAQATDGHQALRRELGALAKKAR